MAKRDLFLFDSIKALGLEEQLAAVPTERDEFLADLHYLIDRGFLQNAPSNNFEFLGAIEHWLDAMPPDFDEEELPGEVHVAAWVSSSIRHPSNRGMVPFTAGAEALVAWLLNLEGERAVPLVPVPVNLCETNRSLI